MALAMLSLTVAFAGTDKYHLDPNVLSVGKLAPRSSFMTYDKAASAASFDYLQSPYFMLLNGEWDFQFTEGETVRTGKITVPGNWEVQGYGTAIYVNHPYEFLGGRPTPPALPEVNPCGIYSRSFRVPAEWFGRDIYLHLAGVKSGAYVYVNGHEVGYNEDSKDPAEYLLNPYLKNGENSLVIKVYRWSTSSYLECQDFWRISGIERDVFLWSQPKLKVRDFTVKSTLDDSYQDGVFSLAVNLKNDAPVEKVCVLAYELADASGNVVISGSSKETVPVGQEIIAHFDGIVPDVLKWSAETPELYKLFIKSEVSGETAEIIPFHVGFRRMEIKDGLFFFNGKTIKFKGVNIHEHNELTGHYVTDELRRKDFELMKANNINAVRLCHYPQDRRFYELCDEIGLYVYDEANIESHGMGYNLNKGRTLGNNPDWLAAHLERTRNMFERNKNFPCVTIWSLGNEAGNGYNFYNTYLFLKDKEKDLMNRPVNYERAQLEWNTDMYVPQYPEADWFEAVGKKGLDRPVVPSEYSHAMGNSNGNIVGQWNAIYKYDQLQGGFIWDWVDQGLLCHDDNGRPYWAYGGDFGVNAPSDANFNCNGIVNPDRNPHPSMAEVKYAYQNFAFEQVEGGLIRVFNRFYFTASDGYAFVASLLCDGKVVKTKKFNLSIAPQSGTEVDTFVVGKDSGEYIVDIRALDASGHVVAQDQFQLGGACTNKYKTSGPSLSVLETAAKVCVASSKVNFDLDKITGAVTSYKVNGVDYIKEGFGFKPSFWRAPTDNDYGCGLPERLAIWKQSPAVKSVAVSGTETGATVEVVYSPAAGNTFRMVYDILPSGVVNISSSFSACAAETPGVPRIGFRFRMPEQFSNVTYYGRGPEENYVDRKAGSPIGVYRTTADALYYPYVRPQENGHHTDTRYLTLGDGKRRLTISSDIPFEFNALRNCVEDFDTESKEKPQSHINDIVPRDYVEVCIDHLHRGVGGYDSWGSEPEPYHMIDACKDYGFTVIVIPE